MIMSVRLFVPDRERSPIPADAGFAPASHALCSYL